MMSAEERKRMDAHMLRNYIQEFINANMSCSDVEHRWLASYANDLLTMAYHVKIGNHNTIKAAVTEFRLNEITKARTDLAAKDAAFEQEAHNLRVEK